MTDHRWMQTADLAWIRHRILVENPCKYPVELRRLIQRLLDHIDAQSECITKQDELIDSTADVVNVHLDHIEYLEEYLEKALEAADQLAWGVQDLLHSGVNHEEHMDVLARQYDAYHAARHRAVDTIGAENDR